MSVQRYVCSNIHPSSSESLFKTKIGIKQDIDGIWFSREAIDRISEIEHIDIWKEFEWTATAKEESEHIIEKLLRAAMQKPE